MGLANEPSVETQEQVAEQGLEVEKEVEVSDCSTEGEGQGSWMDFAVAAP